MYPSTANSFAHRYWLELPAVEGFMRCDTVIRLSTSTPAEGVTTVHAHTSANDSVPVWRGQDHLASKVLGDLMNALAMADAGKTGAERYLLTYDDRSTERHFGSCWKFVPAEESRAVSSRP